MAGVPEAVVHGDGEHSTHEEVRDHVLTLSGHTDGEAADADDHQHHLHLCCGGVALPSELQIALTVLADHAASESAVQSPVRRHQLLLRPPIT